MTFRRSLLAAALPITAAVLTACASPAPASSGPVAAAPAAPTKDTAAACMAELALNATIPPGADPDSPAPAAAEMRAWAASVAGPFATLRDNVPDALRDSVAVLGGQLDQARNGQRLDVNDERSTAASNAVGGWVHENCGFQTLDLASTAGKLGPAPAVLRPGPVSIKFDTTGDPAGFVVLLARVKDGRSTPAADVGLGDFDAVADVVTAAQPSGAEPGYATATLRPGHYLLGSPLGAPPNFTGMTSLDLTVGS